MAEWQPRRISADEGAALGLIPQFEPRRISAAQAPDFGLPGPEDRTVWGQLSEIPGGMAVGAVGDIGGSALRGAEAVRFPWRDTYVDLLDRVERADVAGARVQDLLPRFEAQPSPLDAITGPGPRRRAEPASELASLDERIRTELPREQAGILRNALRERIRRRGKGQPGGAPDPIAEARAAIPPEITERPLYQAGEAVSEAIETAFPAAPGYHDSLGRTLGRGLGSVAAGVAVGLASGPAAPVTLGALFGAAGAGEAADRAIGEGAGDAAASTAARLGVLAGSTDIVPIEILLRRIPGPAQRAVEAVAKRVGGERVAAFAGRVGLQTVVEAVQEGGQQTLQNLIAREVYKPEQALGEGVVPSAALGGGVGAIAALGREGVVALASRRSSSRTGDRARAVMQVPPPSPADEASPIPTMDIQSGREVVADALAVETANRSLEAAGFQPIGQPVRLNDGTGRTVEGVVTDAETGQDGSVLGVTVSVQDQRFGPDPLEIDMSLTELAERGVTLQGMPMPPSAEELTTQDEAAAQDRLKAQEERNRELEKLEKQIQKRNEDELKRYEELTRQSQPQPTGEPAEPPRAYGVDESGTVRSAVGPEGKAVLGALAGGSPTMDASQLGGALAGMSGTPDGDAMLRALAGTQRTPQGDMVMRALAGQGPQMNAEHLGLALSGMAGSPDGAAMMAAMAGGSPTAAVAPGALAGGTPTADMSAGAMAGASPTAAIPPAAMAGGSPTPSIEPAALAGESPRPDGAQVQAALAGLSGTPQGDAMLSALAGTSPTPDTALVRRALAGRAPTPTGESLQAALAGMSATPQGDAMLAALAGTEPTPEGAMVQAALAGGSPAADITPAALTGETDADETEVRQSGFIRNPPARDAEQAAVPEAQPITGAEGRSTAHGPVADVASENEIRGDRPPSLTPLPATRAPVEVQGALLQRAEVESAADEMTDSEIVDAGWGAEFEPYHEVREPAKVRAMVRSLEAGEELPPIIVMGDKALSGVHRLAAWKIAEETPDVIEIDDADYVAAMESKGYEPGDHIDPEDLFKALVKRGALTQKDADIQDGDAPVEVQGAPLQRAGGDTPKVRAGRSPDDPDDVVESNFAAGVVSGNETVPVASLTGGVRRDAPEERKRVTELAEQIRESGRVDRIIVDQDGNVLEGQHRLEAARELGLERIPVTRVVDLESIAPLDAVTKAVRAAQPELHPQHARQIATHALEAVQAEGDVAKVRDGYAPPTPRFTDGWNGALSGIESAQATRDVGDAQLQRAPDETVVLSAANLQRRLLHGTSAEFDSDEIQPGHDGLIHLSEKEIGEFKRDYRHEYDSDIDTDDMPVLPDLRDWNPVNVGEAMVTAGLMSGEEVAQAKRDAGISDEAAVRQFDQETLRGELADALNVDLIDDEGHIRGLDELLQDAGDMAFVAEEVGDDFAYTTDEIDAIAARQESYEKLRNSLYEAAREKGIKAFKYRNAFERSSEAGSYSVGVIDPAILQPVERQEMFQRDTPADRPTPGAARIRLQRRFTEQEGRVAGDIQRIGKDVFGEGFHVQLAQSIEAPDGAQAHGAYDPANRIAYIALRADEAGMTGSLYHEGLHHLRNAGAFTDAQGADTGPWKTLEREAVAKWREQYGIEERYGPDTEGMDAAQRERLMNEEAIAEALADYQTRGKETGFGPTVRSALNRLMNFFRRMANGLRMRGFATAQDIFQQDIATGAAGRRTDDQRRTELDRQLMTAWHGSPHRFDKFSTEAIGTGEGAQAFGHGLYFSGNKAVADWYRHKLTGGILTGSVDVTVRGKTVREMLPDNVDEGEMALQIMGGRLRDGDSFKEVMQSTLRYIDTQIQNQQELQTEWQKEGGADKWIQKAAVKIASWGDVRSFVSGLSDGDVVVVPRGATYKVDLAPKEDEYLLWDEPLESQSNTVRARIEQFWRGLMERRHREAEEEMRGRGETLEPFSWEGEAERLWGLNEDRKGEDWYGDLSREFGSDKEASMALLATGIRGIKYRDASSRGKDDDATYNYVIFDDADVAIEEVLLQRGGGTRPPIQWEKGPLQWKAEERLSDGSVMQATLENLSDYKRDPKTRRMVLGEDLMKLDWRTRHGDGGWRVGERPEGSTFSAQETFGVLGAMLRGLEAEGYRGDITFDAERKRERIYRRMMPMFGWRMVGVEKGKGEGRTDRFRIAPDADIEIPGAQLQREAQTPAFKRWFGESKVVNADGSPMVVYHGGRFDEAAEGVPSIPHEGMFFTEERDLAERYGYAGQITEAFLKVENPFEPRNPDHIDAPWVQDWINFWRDEDGWTDRESGEEMSDYDVKEMIAQTRLADYDSTGDLGLWQDFLATAREHHDGFMGMDPTEQGAGSRFAGDIPPRVVVVFEPNQIKSVNNRGTFELESPNVLFQRAPSAKRDPKGFDAAASKWAGVDLRGAADAVVKDKERMGGFAEDVRAQLKGTESVRAPGVEVVDKPTQADLAAWRRFFEPPSSWSKKFPSIHALVKSGIQAEIDQSNRIQRLNKDWDRASKKLSKDEFADLTGVMFLGDAEAVTFTDDDLAQMPITDKVRRAYRASRKLIDKIGRFVEQHRRSMSLPLLSQRTKLIRQMAGARNMDRSAFRKLYTERANLIAQQRSGTADPETVGARIDALSEKLHGTQPPSEQYAEWAAEADRIQPRIDETRIRHREGYVPHKFFGRWRIFEKVPESEAIVQRGFNDQPFRTEKAARDAAAAAGGGEVVEIEGGYGFSSQWKHVAGEHGFWPSRKDAVRAASKLSRQGAELRVAPVEFTFPEEQATQLSDAAYYRFMGNVEKMVGLEGQDLQDAVRGVARKRFRRRIAGFAQYRKGAQGFSKNLDRVIRTHIGETVRYVSLDKLKFDAINMMEREGLSENRTTVQSRPVLAAAVQQWFKDVNGQKQVIEGQIDQLLNKNWVTPLRGGLAAGAMAYVASGATANPISPIIGAYIGWRVGRGLNQGGPFPTRAITSGMLGDMSHLKLGMTLNVMSALVNTTQITLNTLPVLGTRATSVGFKRFNKAVLSKIRGTPNADWRLMERHDIHPLNTFAEGTRHQFQGEGKLSKISMAFFTSAEGLNRGVTFLGAVSKATGEGKSTGEAHQFAREAMRRTQFHYGAADKPELYRNVLLRVPAQFKNYVSQQIAFAFGLDPKKELPMFLMSLALLTGALGLPLLDLIDDIADQVADFSPIAFMKEEALKALARSELEGGIATFILRGAPGLAGVDMTGRAGMGDKFLPLTLRDWEGPWISTIKNAVRHGAEGASIEDHIRNITPGFGNPLKVLEAQRNGGVMTSVWKRGRGEYEMTPDEMALKALGARPVREARQQDLRDVERRKIEKRRQDVRRYVDRYVKARQDGDTAEMRRVLVEAREQGVPLSRTSIQSASRAMLQDRQTRSLKQLPRDMRREGARLRAAIDQAAAP